MFDAIFQVLDLYFNRPLFWISIPVTHNLKKQFKRGKDLLLLTERFLLLDSWLLCPWQGRNIMAEGCGTETLPNLQHPGSREGQVETVHASFLFCFCSFWVPRLWNNTVHVYSGSFPLGAVPTC